MKLCHPKVLGGNRSGGPLIKTCSSILQFEDSWNKTHILLWLSLHPVSMESIYSLEERRAASSGNLRRVWARGRSLVHTFTLSLSSYTYTCFPSKSGIERIHERVEGGDGCWNYYKWANYFMTKVGLPRGSNLLNSAEPFTTVQSDF